MPTLTVLTYNLLAPAYTRDSFEYVPPALLAWPARSALLLREILAARPDVACFQEVGASEFAEELEPALRVAGYTGTFLCACAPIERNVGLSIFVRGGCGWALENFVALPVSALARDRVQSRLLCGVPTGWAAAPSGKGWSRPLVAAHIALGRRLRHMPQAALVAVLRRDKHACGHETVSALQHVLVANMHAHWNPVDPDIKVMQVAAVVQKLDTLRRGYADGACGVVLCGDFNAMPRIVRDSRFEDGSVLDAYAASTGTAADAPPRTDLAAAGLGAPALPPTIAAAFQAAPAHSGVASGVYALLTTGELAPDHPHHPFTRKRSTVLGHTPRLTPAPVRADAEAVDDDQALATATAAAPAASAAPKAAADAAADTDTGTVTQTANADPTAGTGEASAAVASAEGGTVDTLAVDNDGPQSPLSPMPSPPRACAAAPSPTTPRSPPIGLHPASVPHIHLPLRFVSAYAAVAGAEPAWSNWHTHGFRECLDYMFVATHAREVAVCRRSHGTSATEPATAWAPIVPPPASASAAAAPVARGGSSGGSSAAGGGGGVDLVAAMAALATSPPISGASGGAATAGCAFTATDDTGAGGLVPAGTWALPDDADILACEGALAGGCPNAGQGSDHVALAAVFRVR